jgi:hypothetical protein
VKQAPDVLQRASVERGGWFAKLHHQHPWQINKPRWRPNVNEKMKEPLNELREEVTQNPCCLIAQTKACGYKNLVAAGLGLRQSASTFLLQQS